MAAALLALAVSCSGSGPSDDGPPVSNPPVPPEPVDLASVYERTDRDFDSAVMFRPDDAFAELEAFTLAPLILIENGAAGRQAPEVLYERTERGWTYRWQDPESGRIQGVHLTVGDDGFPLAAEVLTDSASARLLFVDQTLEEGAGREHGAPHPGRRWSVERAIEESPNVAVGGIFEPGSTPLGPFVYLWEATHDVNVVLCRCMPPRVFDIVDSIPYTMKPGETPGFEPLALDAVLRPATETD